MLSLLLALTPAPAADLRLEIIGALHERGQVLVALYDDEQGWPSKPALAARIAIATPLETTVVTFSDLPPGRYAAFAVHDENGNQVCDLRSILGIPKEPIGASRDARPSFGPPRFDAAAFEVVDGTNVQRFSLRSY